MSIISRRHLSDGSFQAVTVDATGETRALAGAFGPAGDAFRVDPEDPWSPEVEHDGEQWAVYVPEPLRADEEAWFPFSQAQMPSSRFRLIGRHASREDARSAARDWMAGLGADSV